MARLLANRYSRLPEKGTLLARQGINGIGYEWLYRDTQLKGGSDRKEKD